MAQGAKQATESPFAGLPAAVLDAVPHGLVVFDAAREVVFANAAARANFASIADPGQSTFADLRDHFYLFDPVTESRIPYDQTPVARALRGETVPNRDYLLRRTDGGLKGWLECGASPLRDEGGTVTGAVFSFNGITERKQQELAFEASAQLRDFVYHENLAGIIHTSVDGRIIDCNEAILRMWGYASKQELLSVRADQLYCEASHREKLLASLNEPGGLSEHEICFRRKDGSRGWALLNVRILAPSAGEVGGSMVSTVIDITERKRSEDTLRKSEHRFAAFMQYLPGVAFIKDLQGRYVYYNEASVALFGKHPGEIVGRTDEEVWPAEHASIYRENDANVINTRRHYEFIESVRHRDGEHSWLIYKFPIMENNKVTMVGGVGIDITERQIMEQQLIQVRKMDALGQLAGGVAHDFNNLLTVISGFGQLAVEALGEPPDAAMADYLTRILDGTRRASGITGQLLAFSRREVVKPVILDLREVIAGMEKLLRTMAGEHIDFRMRMGYDPCLVLSDEHQLQQVVINLVVNARDAMPLGGQLEIYCHTVANPARVLLEIRDNGIGMDEATQSRIFEPFFTSKEKGKGTGLGLSTVYGIVLQAQGTVEVESALAEGSIFRVHFPLAAGEKVVLSEAPAKVPASGRERVLLVEDDAAVRSLAVAVLQRLGYEVTEAESGAAALFTWEKERGAFDILLTDVVMPNMSGGELAIALREKNPHLKVLFMSGYAGDMLSRFGVLEGQTQMIRKPFSPDALGMALRHVLDA